MANNDELIKENVQSLDMNKLVSFTDTIIQTEQDKQNGQIESAEKENTATLPLKSLGDFITDENLDSFMNMAKSIINPSTLSLFSHLSNSINRHEGNTDLKEIEQIIEQLTSELKKVHQDLIDLKYELSELRLLNSVLQNEIESIKSRRRKKFLWF